MKNKIPPKTVTQVFTRDNYTCQKCFQQQSEYDHSLHCHHIKTTGAGGKNTMGNLVTLCWECHGKVHTGEIKINSIK